MPPESKGPAHENEQALNSSRHLAAKPDITVSSRTSAAIAQDVAS